MRTFVVIKEVDPLTYEHVGIVHFDGKRLDVKLGLETIQDLRAMHGHAIIDQVLESLIKELKVEVPDVTDEELAQLAALL